MGCGGQGKMEFEKVEEIGDRYKIITISYL